MSLLLSLLDLLFPPRCVFCRGALQDESEVAGVCAQCLAAVPDPGECCPRCAQPGVAEESLCPECHGQSYAFASACAVLEYSGPLRNVIHKYKYRGRKELAVVLGALVARQVRRCSWPQADAVVPIPLHADRLMERGYDQALLLSQAVAAELQIPVKQILVRKAATPSQTKLSARQRWQNVTDAFTAEIIPNPPERVLLVDDLLTTGATAHFAAQALLEGGTREVCLAVVGR